MTIYRSVHWSPYTFVYESNLFDYLYLVDPPIQTVFSNNKPEKVWRYKHTDRLEGLEEMPEDYKAEKFEGYSYGFLDVYIKDTDAKS